MKGSTTRRRSIKTAKPGGFAATIIYGDKSFCPTELKLKTLRKRRKIILLHIVTTQLYFKETNFNPFFQQSSIGVQQLQDFVVRTLYS